MIFEGGREDWTPTERHDHRMGSIIAAVLAFLVFCILLGRVYAQDARVIPDPDLTPGVVASTDQAEICGVVGGLTYSKRHRQSQNEETKRQVLARYNVPWSDRARYEDDHIVPLCAGGSDDLRNRWPQPRFGIWTSAQKDELEAYACRQVCHGHVVLTEAQAWFLAPADWRQAYCQYFDDAACSSLPTQ